MHEEIIKTQRNKNQSPNLVTSQRNLYKSIDNRGESLGVFTFLAYGDDDDIRIQEAMLTRFASTSKITVFSFRCTGESDTNRILLSTG